MTQLLSPTGLSIVGTVEVLFGTARICNLTDVERFEYVGGTDVDWDGAWTETIDGDAMFVDDEGIQWMGWMLIPETSKPLSEYLLDLLFLVKGLGAAIEANGKLQRVIWALAEGTVDDVVWPVAHTSRVLRTAFTKAAVDAGARIALELAEQKRQQARPAIST